MRHAGSWDLRNFHSQSIGKSSGRLQQSICLPNEHPCFPKSSLYRQIPVSSDMRRHHKKRIQIQHKQSRAVLPGGAGHFLPPPTYENFSTKAGRLFAQNRNLSTYAREGEELAEVDFRTIMRYVPQPIVIVTTYARAPYGEVHSRKDKDQVNLEVSDYRAMTVSSFNTVSMNPPTVSFNIRKPSRTLDAIRKTGKFRLLVMKQEDTAAEIAREFSEGTAEDAFLNIQRRGVITKKDKYGPSFSEGVLAELCCEVPQNYAVDIADHVVLFARLLTLKVLEMPGSTDTSRCLIYSEKGFHRLGLKLGEQDRKTK